MIATYAISGMIAGIFNRLGKIGVIAGFTLGNILLSYVTNGNTTSIIAIQEILIASLGLLAVPKTMKIDIEDLYGKVKLLPDGREASLEENSETIYKLNSMSETIFEMARTYKEAAATIVDEEELKKQEENTAAKYERGLWGDVLHTLKENKLAMFCVIMLSIIVIMAVLAPLSPYDPDKQDVMAILQKPSKEHWFGTDELGRDYFTRALYGGRISLSVGFLSMLLSTTIGTLIGTFSGYMGGKVDTFLMRFTDIFMSVPSMMLMVVINSIFPPKVYSMIIILGLFEWCQIARITRAETLSLKERDYVLASKHLGASHSRIIFKHIIPNMSSSIIVAGSLAVARAILTESALSFVGLGVQLPKASWGTMLQSAQMYMTDVPTLAVFPGVFIVLTVFSFNIIGDALRVAMEPKMIK